MSITRRTFVGGMGALVTAAALPAGSRVLADQPAAGGKPNIILFLADDMRYDSAGFAGNRVVQTPNLDRLAENSVVFDNAFVTTAVCATSRASIYTGDYALRHKVYDFKTYMKWESYQKSFFRALKASGYYTGFVGKWGVGKNLPSNEFDRWYGFSGHGMYIPPTKTFMHLNDIQTRQAIDFMKGRPKDKPFLLIVSYKAPHEPYHPQTRFSHLYWHTPIERQPSDNLKTLDKMPPFLRQHFNNYVYDEQSDKKYADRVRLYYQLVTGLDDSVGRILDYAGEQGAADDTSVIFGSDNGMMLGSHGMWGKWWMYEGSIRIPMVIQPAKNHFPYFKPSRSSAMALNIDISPTIYQMAGLETPNVHGKSLLPVMFNHEAPLRDGFYYEFRGTDGMYTGVYPCAGYRTKDWKFTRYYRPRNIWQFNDCLYDMKNDPEEFNNLVGNSKYEDKRKELLALMVEEKRRLEVL